MLRRPPEYVLALALLALGIAAAWTADQAWKSVTTYQTRYAIEADLPSGEAKVSRLVLIVFDGLRADALEHAPNWRDLGEKGAAGLLRTPMPSLSNPARATMMTGAPPEVHGVTNNGKFSPPPVDSLLSVARSGRVHTAVAGSRFWKQAFGEWIDESWEFEKELHVVTDPQELIDWQRETCAPMVEFLRKQTSGLVIAGVTAADAAGHDFGGESDEYAQVVREADACLGRIVTALDDPEAAFLAISDHGHIDRRGRGGHGGSETEVVWSPFVLAGSKISPTNTPRRPMEDAAPLAALLLGLPIPANSRGAYWPEVLGTDDESQWQGQQAIEIEQVERPEAVRDAEHSARMPVTILLGLLFGALLAASVVWEENPWPSSALAVLLFLVAYLSMFQIFGLATSLSAIVREEYTNAFFGRNVAAAALAYVLSRRLAGSQLLFATTLCAGFALKAVAAHGRTGLLMRGAMPDLDIAFAAYLDLLGLFGVALIAVMLWAMQKAFRRSAPKAG